MLRLWFVIFLVLAMRAVFGQYGNEWIDPTQQYFKIPVAREGIYRLTYSDLQAADFPVASADYRRIQLFHRGLEQHIKVQKANLGNIYLEAGDYIEFFGVKNDGASDSVLYSPSSAQPHKYHNLYNDTTSYFLTFTQQVVLGKRMVETTETNQSGIPAELYHTDSKLMVMSNQYSTGMTYEGFVQHSFFDVGEGWSGTEIVKNQSISYAIEGITNSSQANGLPQLEIMILGRAMVQHQVQVAVGPTAGSRIVATQTFSNVQPIIISAPLQWSDISAGGTLVVSTTALGVGADPDRLSVSYIKVTYPQSFNAGSISEKYFLLNPNAGNKSYVEIQNPPAGGKLYDVTNPDAPVILRTVSSTSLNAVVPSTASTRRLLLASPTAFTTPSIKRVNFESFAGAQPDFVIISHPSLMKSSGPYPDVVQAYADYRSSVAGGGHATLVVSIQQLYDQFNYGEQSPIAIRRFMKRMIDQGDPRYLLLIGKALDVRYGYYRNPQGFPVAKDLVPTAGMPGSDIAFTVGLDGNQLEPAVATGRITATIPGDVAAYLNKVKEMEAKPFDALWRKNLLHLSGGITGNEPETFKSYLEGMQFVAENEYLGGSVTAIGKSFPIQQIEFINISDEINNGVSLVTLFGHSTSSTSDINIGFVSAQELGYSNPGRYPMFLVNGCNAGDFFDVTKRYGEDWVNAPNKGAVAFMAKSSFALGNLLNLYSSYLYQLGYGDSANISKGIGDIIKIVARRFESLGQTNLFYSTQIQQTVLLGDPAVRLFGASKPDYAIDNASVYVESFNSEPITAQTDSFAIKISISNFGRVKEDQVMIRVTRTFKDNSSVVYDSLFPNVFYKDTLTFVIPRDREKGFDSNEFMIEIDPLGAINELNENNNLANLTVFIPLNSSRNLFPQGFSIVSTTSPNLVVQSTDLIGDSRGFIIEMDTIDTFDSDFLQQYTVSGKIVTQAVQLLDIDSTAYYWRTRFTDVLPGETEQWTVSSFSYIEGGQEGWAQLHFPQYNSNELLGLVSDPSLRRITLKETVTDVDIYTFGSASGISRVMASVKINGSEYNPQSFEKQCRDHTINIIAFAKESTAPYISIPIQGIQFLDFRACGRRPEVIASFKNNEVNAADGKNLIEYIEHVVNGDSVVLFSIGDPQYSTWPAGVITKLEEIGISDVQFATITNGEPVVIFTKKGASPGSALILKAQGSPADEQELTVQKTITGRYTSGTMTSGLIGPAEEWISLTPVFKEVEQYDLPMIDVFGYNLQGDMTLLFDSVSSAKDLSSIDASFYPLIQLRYVSADTINLTAPQLDSWIVSYTPVAEGVLASNNSAQQQQLFEGDVWKGTYGFTNISSRSFETDSLVVRYYLFNKSAKGASMGIQKILSPAPGATTNFDLNVQTKGKAGLNDFDVYVNPRIVPEVYYDNNLLQLNNYLNVSADVFGPVLEVTFDGRVIHDGDFASSNPVIKASVWDDNSFLPELDTTGIKIFLQYPCGLELCDFEPIYLNRGDVTVHPATENSNFYVEFKPVNLQPGTYALQVEAQDVVGNVSSEIPYQVRFVVSDNDSMEIVKPYPNPSSGSVHFPVVITAGELPRLMTVRIISSNGFEIGSFSFDSFFVGTNDLVWNGNDVAGNRLPGGLYFYQLRLIMPDQTIVSRVGRLIIVK